MGRKELVKQTWLERAIQTHNYHCSKLKEDEGWTITDTSRTLKRSLGSICEDLLIAGWLRTHETKIRRFKYAYQALAFIRNERKHMMTEIRLE